MCSLAGTTASRARENILAASVKAGSDQMGSAYDFSFTSIDGRPMPLSNFKGKVLMVVNTASFCGFTQQYKGLQALYDKYEPQGFVVIGVPSNHFGGQEPGRAATTRSMTSAKARSASRSP
jgi:glutathione peroxidase